MHVEVAAMSKKTQSAARRQQKEQLPRCLRALPMQLMSSCCAQIVAGAQRLDVTLARTILELRRDADGLVFEAGWPRGSWPKPKTTLTEVADMRGNWLTRESKHDIVNALCLPTTTGSKTASHCCVPIQFLGAGSYGTVFAGAGGSIALKFAVPCPFTWFSPKHEFEMQARLASLGAAFGVSELLRGARAETIANANAWKGEKGAEFLSNPSLPRLREAVRDCVCVIVMERSDGTLVDYLSRSEETTVAVAEQRGAAIGLALAQLLKTIRDCGAVHNDAKIDNIGCMFQFCQSIPVLRFLDCGMSFCADTLSSLSKRKIYIALKEGSIKDACTLVASLAILARALQGDRQKKACAAAAWTLAKEVWELFEPNLLSYPEKDLDALEALTYRRAQKASRCVCDALNGLQRGK